MKIYLTEHSIERIDERTKNHYFISNQKLTDIWNNGKIVSDMKGNLKDWIDKKIKEHKNRIIKYYNGHVYIFSPVRKDSTYLITVIGVPKKFLYKRKINNKKFAMKPIGPVIEPMPMFKIKH